jgi:hypothetical protein
MVGETETGLEVEVQILPETVSIARAEIAANAANGNGGPELGFEIEGGIVDGFL